MVKAMHLGAFLKDTQPYFDGTFYPIDCNDYLVRGAAEGKKRAAFMADVVRTWEYKIKMALISLLRAPDKSCKSVKLVD